MGQGLEGIVTDAGAGRIRETHPARAGPGGVRPGAHDRRSRRSLDHRARHGGGRLDAHQRPPPRAGARPEPAVRGLLPFLLSSCSSLVVITRSAVGAGGARYIGEAPWIGGGFGGGGFGGGGGWRRRRRVRRVRRRWWIQRRRRRRAILMRDTVDRVVDPFLAAADSALGAGVQRGALRLGRPGRLRPGPLRHQPDAGARRRVAPAACAPWGRAFAAWRKADAGAAAADQPGRVGPRGRCLSDRDHRHARRRIGCCGGPIRWPALVVEPARPAPGARARVPGQAAPPAAGLRGRCRRASGAGRRWRGGAPPRSWCCSARCSRCWAGRCRRRPAGARGRGGRCGRRRRRERWLDVGPRIGASAAGAARRRSSSSTWTRWRGRRGSWTNFSSEISDEALVGGRLRARSASRS